MLKSIRIHNFKTFLNAEFRFSRRHLVLGKNNSGKSNLFGAISFLGSTGFLDLDKAANLIPGGITELRNWYSKSDQCEIACDCELLIDEVPCRFEYELVLRFARPTYSVTGALHDTRILRERLTCQSSGQRVLLLESDGIRASFYAGADSAPQVNGSRREVDAPQEATFLSRIYESPETRRITSFRRYLGTWASYALSPMAMRQWGSKNSVYPGAPLQATGGDLANAVFYLKNFDDRRYERVIKHVQLVEPDLKGIAFLTPPDGAAVPFLRYGARDQVSWNGMSSGTLCLLAYAIIVEYADMWLATNPENGSLIMIEEPENGVFPGLLDKIISMFEEWAPGAQVLFTSHSPYFIDLFDARRSDVTILRRSADRSEIVQPYLREASLNGDRLTLAQEYAGDLLE